MIEITVPIANVQFVDKDGYIHEYDAAWDAFFGQFYSPLDYYLSQLGDA